MHQMSHPKSRVAGASLAAVPPQAQVVGQGQQHGTGDGLHLLSTAPLHLHSPPPLHHSYQETYLRPMHALAHRLICLLPHPCMCTYACSTCDAHALLAMHAWSSTHAYAHAPMAMRRCIHIHRGDASVVVHLPVHVHIYKVGTHSRFIVESLCTRVPGHPCRCGTFA